MSLLLTLALLKVIPGELRLKSFPSPHGLNALWQRPTFPGRQTRGSAQGRDKVKEMLQVLSKMSCPPSSMHWGRG